jgi:hypothetical protein
VPIDQLSQPIGYVLSILLKGPIVLSAEKLSPIHDELGFYEYSPRFISKELPIYSNPHLILAQRTIDDGFKPFLGREEKFQSRNLYINNDTTTEFW